MTVEYIERGWRLDTVEVCRGVAVLELRAIVFVLAAFFVVLTPSLDVREVQKDSHFVALSFILKLLVWFGQWCLDLLSNCGGQDRVG